ncbi:hypothetical protein Q9R23_13900 [Exiguobacterium sp. BRG2]|uniref:hypothetical protein n=1 Tax=Exiguobacterium sp. BRG2 TaxID=2962584 RepID=UPI00288197D5|nr:hypothetical protein [Exiguobacterium sp. BRG2]MDT0174066.1 hypothetical protein [Exiguobacterium sp. BRG2]
MKRLIFFISPLLVLSGAVFFTTFHPIEQAIYFLILFLLTCLSAMTVVERLVKHHDVIRRTRSIHLSGSYWVPSCLPYSLVVSCG